MAGSRPSFNNLLDLDAAYRMAGDYTAPGIYTVPVAGGPATQLTSDPDYWPSYSADGTKVFFSRDAGSDHADVNAAKPVAPTSADDLYELITERAGRSLVLTSNRAPQHWYPLFPNPVVAESLLDRLINTSHQVFMNGPSYRPNKRPGRAAPQSKTSTV